MTLLLVIGLAKEPGAERAVIKRPSGAAEGGSQFTRFKEH